MQEEVGMYTEKSRKMGKKLKRTFCWGVGLREVWGRGCGVEKRNFSFHLIPFSTV